jgi:hypothetical protein
MTDKLEDNNFHLERFKNKSPHTSYIAGFIDGDGCIFIRKIADGYQSGMQITQCRTNILQILKYHFGGSITSSENRNNKIENLMDDNNEYINKHNVRNQYNLLIRSNEYQILLGYLKNSFVIKEKQYNCLHEFNKIANLPNKLEEKEGLYKICSENNVTTNVIEDNLHKINIEYIAGLFDAEGCIYINKTKKCNFYISIAQKNHPIVLHKIQQFLGFGKVNTSNIEFTICNKSNCLKFIQLVKKHLIVKYNQAIAFESFLQTDDLKIKEEMYTICNKEKHEIEIFTDLNQNDTGKERYLETIKLRSIKEQICKEIQIKEVYREKSEKMKGEGNHNFGKTFSEETRKKMSDSIRDSKGGVSDEIIIKVREFIQKGLKNTEIQELLNLPRHTITRIKTGLLVCRSEMKENKLEITQEQQNINKRKIQTDEIIIVIEKLISKWNPTPILEYLIDRRNRNNIPNNLTIDIIKNIKRNLINGKHVIYESELPKYTYEYYKQIIINFSKMIVK